MSKRSIKSDLQRIDEMKDEEIDYATRAGMANTEIPYLDWKKEFHR